MSVAKVIEVIAEGKTIEEAVNNGVHEASETVKGIKHVDIKHMHAHVEDGKVRHFRVILKISFVVDK